MVVLYVVFVLFCFVLFVSSFACLLAGWLTCLFFCCLLLFRLQEWFGVLNDFSEEVNQYCYIQVEVEGVFIGFQKKKTFP